jgi:glycerol kinase
MAYQTRDVLDVMHQDAELPVKELRVDGGASVMDLLLQFQADITSIRRFVARQPLIPPHWALLTWPAWPVVLWQDLSELSEKWRGSAYFEPQMGADQRQKLYAGWSAAVKRSLGWVEKK